MTIYAGFFAALTGKPVEDEAAAGGAAVGGEFVDDHESLEEIHFAYCTEFLVSHPKPDMKESDVTRLRERLERIGDCVVVVSDMSIVKVHVHTNDPGRALQMALELGELDSIKIDNMLEEFRERMAKRESELKEYGMVSVALGEGFEEIFKDLMVDKLVGKGLVVCLLIALAIGAANAVGVLVLKIAPFVMTLCTMTILEGVCYVYTQGAPTGSAAPAIRTLGTGHLGQVPYSTVIWLALALVMWVVIRYTTLGRKLYAVGGNAQAARLSGISNRLVVAGAYVFSALMSMLAGIILSGYLNITSLTVGGDYVMNSLASVLIGGNAIEGGRGGVWGVVLGAFFMMFLMAILTMVGMSEVGKLIVQGVIIFAVVAFQSLMKKD